MIGPEGAKEEEDRKNHQYLLPYYLKGRPGPSNCWVTEGKGVGGSEAQRSF